LGRGGDRASHQTAGSVGGKESLGERLGQPIQKTSTLSTLSKRNMRTHRDGKKGLKVDEPETGLPKRKPLGWLCEDTLGEGVHLKKVGKGGRYTPGHGEGFFVFRAKGVVDGSLI